MVASFSGDPASTATATLTTLNGTSYDVCTTTQYNAYMPSSNSTSITVTPQTTIGATTRMNLKQMQNEVKSGGWLNVYNRFSLGYPWYRLHVKIAVEGLLIDVGFCPVLPFGTTWVWQGLEIFGGVTEEILQDVVIDFAGGFGSYVIAKALGIGNIAAGLIMETVKGIVQYTFLHIYWNDKAVMLAMAIVNLIMGFISVGTNVGEAFAKGLFNVMYGQTWEYVVLTTSNMAGTMGILQDIPSPIDLVESLGIDFPIFTFALLRYLGKM